MPDGSENNHDALLARLDERSKSMKESLDKLIDALPKNYVNKEDFDPVKRIVYGLTGAVLFAVFGAIIKLVLSK